MSERDIFLAAIEIPVAADRRAYLDQACAGDPFLRAQVDALLKAYDDPKSFLAHPAVEQVAGGSGGSSSAATPDAPNAAHGSEQVLDKTPKAGSDATEDFSRADPDGVLSGLLSPSTEPGSLGRLGHFEVQQVLGTGGFGTVLRAFDDKLHRMVAIKLMSAEMASTSPARKRFLREARAAAAIRHEHVVNIHSVEEEPLPYLVMEFIPGQTLEQKLNGSGPLELSEVLRLGEQIAQGLAAAHAMGLVHRDIKPANILLESGVKERVKITDFGLARTADDATVTQSGVIAGTPMYMAPEQAWGLPLDQRADLFSLGSVLYQMVSGRPPFRAETTLAVLKRVTEDTPRPIQEIIPETPTWLCAIIAKLQEKQPEDRIQSAKDLADLLGQCRRSLEQGTEPKLPWPVPAAAVRTAPPVAPVVPRPATSLLRLRRIPKRVWMTAVLLPLVMLGVWVSLRATVNVGTLVIEVDDPEISVSIKGDRRGVEFAKGSRDPRVELPPGRYTVLADKNGQRLAEAVIEIKRGHRDVLKLDLTSKNLAGVSSAETNPDRRAAEYVLSIGGVITINTQEREVINIGDLPQTVFELTGVKLSHNLKVTDAEFVNFRDCKNLTYLGLDNTQVGDTGLGHFTASKSLTFLELSGTQVTNAGLAHFKDCKNLLQLGLGGTLVSDAGLAHFQDCKNLTVLNLGNTRLSDEGLAYFKDCKNLITLGLGQTEVSDEGLVHIKASKSLTSLVLDHTKVSDAGLADLAAFSKLGYLSVKKTKVTEAGVKKLSAALPGCKIEWDGGVFEPTVDSDRKAAEWLLSIGGQFQYWENGELRLIKAGNLLPEAAFHVHTIGLSDNPRLMDADLNRIAGLSELESLYLIDTAITDAGLEHLRKLPKLQNLFLQGTRITDAGLPTLREVPSLRSLTLDSTRITDEGLAHLPEGLIGVDLGHTVISDAGLKKLAQSQQLTSLSVGGTKITDSGLKEIAVMKQLGSLELFGTSITDLGLDSVKQLPNLKFLGLSGTGITDDGLSKLGEMKSLISLDVRSLEVRENKVTADGVKKLAAALRQCKIYSDHGTFEPSAAANHDRRAAEYVLSIGGSIVIRANGQELEGLTIQTLPAEPFELIAISLESNRKVSDAGLSAFEHCKHIETLYLNATQVTDVGLAYFQDCKKLTTLWLGDTDITDTGLAYFKDCKQLAKLHLGDTQVGEVGLANFQDCQDLTDLYLGWSPRVNDAGLAYFQNCKKLKHLDLVHTSVSDAGLVYFKDCKDLVTLGLGGNEKISDAGLVNFRDCKKLRELYLSTSFIKGSGLIHFKDCEQLEYLDLAGSHVDDAGLAHFQNCKNLTTLLLNCPEMTNAGLAHFQDLKKLHVLTLNSVQVGDAGMTNFSECKNLANLDLSRTQVSDAGLAAFKNCVSLRLLNVKELNVSDAGLAHLKDCKRLSVIDLTSTRISDAALADLASLPNLSSLNLDGTRVSLRGHEQLKTVLPKCQITWTELNRNVVESVLALGGTVEIGEPGQPDSRPVLAAADLPDKFFQVHRVSLAGVTKPLDKLPLQLSWLRFAEFDRLEKLDLSGISGFDYGLLAPIHGLQELSLAKSGLNETTIAGLPKLPTLKRLVLDGNILTESALISLGKQSALTELSLANAGLNDQLLGQLPKLPALKRLVLDGNEIRGGGLAALKAHPELIDVSLECPHLIDLTARNLAELKQLQRLSLARSNLTDTGIKHLAGLTNLTSLNLRETKVTATGIGELKSTLPNCQIQWDGMADQ